PGRGALPPSRNAACGHRIALEPGSLGLSQGKGRPLGRPILGACSWPLPPLLPLRNTADPRNHLRTSCPMQSEKRSSPKTNVPQEDDRLTTRKLVAKVWPSDAL